MTRLARLLAAAGLVTAATVAPAGPATGAVTSSAAIVPAGSVAMSACTSADAVVAVDFGHWGGPVVRGCGTVPTTGYQLVNQGGFATTGTRHDGPGFVCRIASTSYAGGAAYPTAAQEPCVLTPPSSAYWSYWHAAPGATTWSYATRGAMSTSPEAGSADLWTFGSTDTTGSGGSGQPRITPAQVRAGTTGSGSGGTGGTGGDSSQGPTATSGSGSSAGSAAGGSTPAGTATPGSAPRGSAPASTAPAGTATTTPSAGAGSTPAGPTSSTATTPTPSTTPTGGPTPGATTGPTTGPTPATGAPPVVDASGRPATSPGPDLASTGPALAGLVVVLLVGGAAVVVARRRRRTDA